MREWIFDYRILRRFRIASEKTQGQAAKKAGLTQANICQWESGKTTPTVKSLLKICNAFYIGPELLFKRREIEESHSSNGNLGVSVSRMQRAAR